MAINSSSRCLCFLIVVFSGLIYSSQAYSFVVGGRDGWVLYPSENYNQWAGRMRFQVNDTIFFKYKKGSDSVLVVSKDDYYKCNTKYPILKLDGGDSTLKFDRSGPFFFISGKNGSCDKGQKLIVVVMAVRYNKPITPPAPSSQPPAATPPAPSSQPPVATPPAPSSQPPAATPPAPSSQPPVASPVSPSPASSPPAFSPTPATTPTSPAPAMYSPVPSPAPATSPMSPAPATEGPTPSPSPYAGSPEVSPSPTGTPEASPSPAITPSPEYVPGVSPSPGNVPVAPSPSGVLPSSPPPPVYPPPGDSPPPTGDTPADIRSPPPPGPSSSPAMTPSLILLSTVTLVLSLSMGSNFL